MDMVRIGSMVAGQSVLLPGSTYEVGENGIASLSESYSCNADDLMSLIPLRGAAHSRFPNLTLKEVQSVTLELQMARYTLKYTGLGAGWVGGEGDVGFPPPVYSLTRSQGAEPIATHPNFDLMKAAAGASGVAHDPNGIFLGFTDSSEVRSLVGVSDYLRFGAVFSKSSVQSLKPSLSGVGFIDNPPSAPSVAEGFNWLKIDASYEEEGRVYAVNESWMLSARGGWDPLIYGD